MLGNLPMLAGTSILKATTLSGAMVWALAPVFLFHRARRASSVSFHLSFWTGLVLGLFFSLGWIPDAIAIGDGRYAQLLGVNLYGLALCTALFWAPVALSGWRDKAWNA